MEERNGLTHERKKLIIGIGFIIAAAAFLGYEGISESRSYYMFVDEVLAMGEEGKNIRIKIHGSVVPGSVARGQDGLSFIIENNQKQITVRYSGTKPVPDSFKEGAPVIIDGRLLENGDFQGNSIQAKCASKYEAEYNKTKPQK